MVSLEDAVKIGGITQNYHYFTRVGFDWNKWVLNTDSASRVNGNSDFSPANCPPPLSFASDSPTVLTHSHLNSLRAQPDFTVIDVTINTKIGVAPFQPRRVCCCLQQQHIRCHPPPRAIERTGGTHTFTEKNESNTKEGTIAALHTRTLGGEQAHTPPHSFSKMARE